MKIASVLKQLARVAVFGMALAAFSPVSLAEDACPDGYPLSCGNGKCCPSGSTYYCPQMEPTPCIDPKKLTDEQLKTLADNCKPLLSCS
jgi:hypothetical protein